MGSVLTAGDLRAALLASLDDLRAARGAIDAANVYPVPDADTGTNLVMTFEAVAARIAEVGNDDGDIAAAIAAGALVGARGNSGIIMAQVLRAWAEAVAARPAKPRALVAAFSEASALAREAVLEPADGTILSVLEAVAEGVRGRHRTVASVFAAAAEAGARALDRTPDQMRLLADNGVVDAGGMGLVTILTAMARSLGAEVASYSPTVRPGPTPAAVCAEGREPGGSRYEVMYLLETDAERVQALRQLLGSVGDSVVVSGGGDAWRVHVHTDDPGKAAAFGEAVGEVRDLRTVDLLGGESAAPVGGRGIAVADLDAPAGLIVVAEGAGAIRLFGELGARVLTAEEVTLSQGSVIVGAVEEHPAAHVIVLPNSEEVFARARALFGESERVTILRTGDLAAGLAVAVAYGDSRPAEDSLRDMRAAIDQVRTGQVTTSAVPVESPAGPVAVGQSIGFAEGAIVAIDDDAVAVAEAVAIALAGPSTEVVTVLCGEGVEATERDRACAAIARGAGGASVEMHDGGQPTHRYLLAAE